jgi:hypothetical protein
MQSEQDAQFAFSYKFSECIEDKVYDAFGFTGWKNGF